LESTNFLAEMLNDIGTDPDRLNLEVRSYGFCVKIID
jgi:hypothetical protein